MVQLGESPLISNRYIIRVSNTQSAINLNNYFDIDLSDLSIIGVPDNNNLLFHSIEWVKINQKLLIRLIELFNTEEDGLQCPFELAKEIKSL